MGRTATMIAMLAVLLTPGCSGGVGTPAASPGEEITTPTRPSREAADPGQETEQNGSQETSVELPGLPIGGSQIEFTEPHTRCADVSLTGEPLPQGIRVRIRQFDVPRQFSVSSEACGSAPPCLGADLPEEGSCQVAVTWNGEPLAEGQSASLAVRSAEATCAEQAPCERARAIVAEAAPQAIGIRLPATHSGSTETTDEPTDSTEETTGSTDAPTDAGSGAGSS